MAAQIWYENDGDLSVLDGKNYGSTAGCWKDNIM